MLTIKNILLSGFTFTEEEDELKLQFILLNSILIIIILMLSLLAFVRYLNLQESQSLIDFGAVSASFITMLFARKSKKSINIAIPILLTIFYLLITYTFKNIGLIGTTWYIVLILVAFFLKGTKSGLFFSILSLLTIFILEKLSNVEHTLFQYIYIIMPIALSVTFLYLYERRNEILNNLLKEQKESLQDEVKKQTQELSNLLTQSLELSEIMKNSLLEIYIVDFHNDQYLYANDKAMETLGYEEHELSSMNIYDVDSSMTHENLQNIKQLMQKNGNTMNISQHTRKDNSTYGIQSFLHKITYKTKEAYVIFDIQISNVQQAESEILRQKELLAYQAHYDTLTKLPNRVLLAEKLFQAKTKATQNQTKFALFFIDIDHFKNINDTYGHKRGDSVLIEVAKRLTNSVRRSDTVARLSGDEFLIILEEFKSSTDIAKVAKSLIQNIEKPMNFTDLELIVTCSLGISIYPDDNKDPDILIKYADKAMYKAKNLGKNNFKFYT
jgi:diguanylate cyclase (GGDEF)-like protein/PAS domain S-box-containing protein